jgi:hypothetical protein
MTRIQTRSIVAIAVMSMLGALPAAAAGQAPGQEALMQEMQERMRQAAELGPRHEALGEFVGHWDVEIAMVMPGAPEQRSRATAEYAWAIDGRWLTQRIRGEMMGGDYEGFSLIGYDNYAKNHDRSIGN